MVVAAREFLPRLGLNGIYVLEPTLGDVLGTARNILLICDVPECQERVGSLLSAHGYRMYYAKTVQQAIDVLATTAIDAVHMDLSNSRHELAPLERIKNHLSGLPITIAVDDLPAQPSQAITFVRRPVNPETLLRTIHFPQSIAEAVRPDQEVWLQSINRSLRVENGQLYDTLTQNSHELRNLAAQVDVLIAKLLHPTLGTLSTEHRFVLDEMQLVTGRLNQIADYSISSGQGESG